MKSFIFLIGTTDDFESVEDLKNTYFNGGVADRNMSVYTFDVKAADTSSVSVREIAFLVGCGIAFTNDWCMDGTFSTLLEA